MLGVSVSEIHLCHRCPRLLGYQCTGKKNAWKAGMSGTDEMPGAFFHERIAAPFYHALVSGENKKALQKLTEVLENTGENDREKYLLAFLEKYFFVPVITRHGKRFESGKILKLGRGLELWNRCLTGFFNRLDPEKKQGRWEDLLKKIVHDPETAISIRCKLDEKTMLRIKGRYDALMLDPEKGEAVLIEFKGRKAGESLDEDFLQVALYAWIFKHKTGISPGACIIYLEEEDPEFYYDSNTLKKIDTYLPGLLRQVVSIIRAVPHKNRINLPVPSSPDICIRCPFDRICDSDWGVRQFDASSAKTGSGEKSLSEDNGGQTGIPVGEGEFPQDNLKEADEGLKNLCNAFESLKLPVEALGYIVGPRFIRYKVKPVIEKGSTAKKLKNQSENIQVELGLSAAPMIQPQAGFVSVDVPRENSVPLTLGEVWRLGGKNRPDSAAAFPMGMAIDGSIFWADLTDPNMTGILVGGASGSGKSVFLRSAVIGLALNAPPDKIRMTLIDPKRVSFTDLGKLPHLAGPIVMDDDIAIDTLKHLIDEMEERYRRFESRKVQDIGRYNGLSKPMAHHVVIIDEYADLMVHKDAKSDLEKLVQRLGQKGRAAGIHIVLATQRPDAKVVTPVIKANLALKVALKVTTASNSSIILDQTGAEYLIGLGDMLIGGSLCLERLQSPLVTGSEIEKAMAMNRL